MVFTTDDQDEMAQNVLNVVLSKIRQLPISDRSLVVIASVEAIAWIAAVETTTHCRNNGLDRTAARERIDEYAMLFVSNADRSLPEKIALNQRSG
ncbi:MAG: hypothetical protein COB37_11245 [Kordiimonadales bacterium]|nr:MAG: hypothetical protein COB37_11245 [Kordiimonadales bacterium]